jgi:bacterial/archaeal transporter family-2 protein
VSSGDAPDPTTTVQRSIPLWLAVSAAVALGALVSVQARISASLAERSDVYNAAWITVFVGTVILLGILLLSAKARHGFRTVTSALRTRALPWWALIGGLCGMFFVITQGTAAGVLGLAMFGMSVVAGQVVGGLVFDWIGLAGGDKRRPTRLRVLGSLLAIGAVSFGAVAGQGAKLDVLLILMAFTAGAGLALSAGVTGRVNATANNPATTGLINHLVGLLAIMVILLATAPGDLSRFRFPDQPWLYVGGMIGPVGVTLTAILVSSLGVLLLGLGMVAGQLIGALVLELVAPTASGGIQLASVVGIAVTLSAVAITSLDGRVRRDRARTRSARGRAEGERGRSRGAAGSSSAEAG